MFEQKVFCWPLTITYELTPSSLSPTGAWDTVATFVNGFSLHCARVVVGNYPMCAYNLNDVNCQLNFLPCDNNRGYHIVCNNTIIATIETCSRKKYLVYNDCKFFCRLTRKRHIDSPDLGIKTRLPATWGWLKLIVEKKQESPVCDIALFAVCLDLWYDHYFN